MGSVIASLAGIALFAVPGCALTWFFPALRITPWTRRPGYGYLLGVACVSGALYMLSALFGVPLRRPAILGVALAFTVAGLVKARLVRRAASSAPRPALPRGRRLVTAAAVLIAAGVSAGLLANAMSDPLADWDGRMHWAAQARYIRYEGSVLPLAVTRGQWFINHPRYPVLMPVAQAVVLEAVGARQDEFPFRALYAAFFPALLVLLYDGTLRFAGEAGWLPAVVTVVVACGLRFPTFFVVGGATGAYSDLPLAAFAGAALILLLHGRTAQVTAADGILAGLFLGAAVLTKNEGTILAAAVLLAAALPLLRLRRLRRQPPGAPRRRLLLKAARVCAAASIFLAVLAFFLYWRTAIPNRQDENYEEFVQLESLAREAVVRIPFLMSKVLAKTFLTWDHWTGFWWVFAIVLIAGRSVLRGRRAALTRSLALVAATPLAVGWGAYSAIAGPEWMIEVTWERFLVQGSVPLLLLFAVALDEILRRGPVFLRSALKLARLSQ